MGSPAIGFGSRSKQALFVLLIFVCAFYLHNLQNFEVAVQTGESRTKHPSLVLTFSNAWSSNTRQPNGNKEIAHFVAEQDLHDLDYLHKDLMNFSFGDKKANSSTIDVCTVAANKRQGKYHVTGIQV